MAEKFEKYHSAQSWFVKNSEIFKSSRSQAFEIICKKICEVINIERVGIWFYSEDGLTLLEEMTYIQGQRPTKGTILFKKQFPVYFSYIDEQRVLSCSNTLESPKVSELVDSYMIPLKVHALLDAPIFSDGEMLGVVCFETTQGPREWDIQDKNFAASVADFIGRFLEAEKRYTYERELKHRINYLENDLRKKLDDLNEAKFSLDLALEGAQVGKWDWEVRTGKLSLNKTWFTKLDYEYNELPQDISSFKKVIHPEDANYVQAALEDHMQGKTIFYECKYRMITKKGEIQWVMDRGCVTHREPDGSPIQFTGVNINITPIVKLEQSLLMSQQQLQAMIQSLPTPVAMFDREFRYIAFSSRWVQEWSKFGNIKEGVKVQESMSGFKDKWMDSLREALSGITLSKDEDLVELTKELQYWIRWVAKPWKHPSGEIGGVVMMAENITHRKEVDMRVNQASKLSALGEMAGGIAHEINNPLSIIKGYIDLLKRHSSRNSLSQDLMLQYIDKMDQTVGRISRIVSGMRRFSRESSMDEKIQYSFNKVIEETLDICLERINNNGTAVNVEYFKTNPLILCRPIEISQVLLNLINNAFQAISIFPHPWINIKCVETEVTYKVMITDCGPGIPLYIRQKLFQPFFTTKDIGVGTGLGLSISRGIIEEHNGKLYYLDEAMNTTFVIELPKLNKEDTEK